MSFVTLDFETYYAKDFSLTKMTTEEYVNDPRFQVIGVGIKIDDGKTRWITENVEEELRKIDWAESALLCHNTQFDGAILAFKYGIIPAYYFDTLCMARAIHGVDAGGSLSSLVLRYQLGEKGTEVVNALGKRREDFTAEDLAKYGDYCINDTDLTYALFGRLASNFPQSELDLIDITLRMYTQPVLHVDDGLLTERLEEVKEEKKTLLNGLMEKLGCTDEEEVRKKLASNKQFAQILEEHDIKPPLKTSPATGKETYALAKNDEGFIALTEHEDPFIEQLCAVRLGTKSTLEESRIERFIGIGSRNKGRLPIPLKYYGAHTGRWAGSDSVNFQNLPSRDKKKKALKNAVLAPPKHYVINSDSSQIEARILVWLAGQKDVTEQFRKGDDVYSIFASKVYGKHISKETPVERFVGKTCILGLGYGTGARKLQHTLSTAHPVNVHLPEEECRRIVDLYRQENDKVTELWAECDNALSFMMTIGADWTGNWAQFPLGQHNALKVDPEGVRLPNGLYIRYPRLRLEESKMVYDSRRGPVNIWGGAMVENVVQALARIVVSEQMLKIREAGFRPVLTVHDSVVCVVRKEEVDDAMATITSIMSTAPDWAAGLPVACEAKYGESYGDC